MIYFPVIGAFLEAAGMIIEKKVLKNKKLNSNNYVVYEFFSIVVMGLLFMLFFFRIDSSAFELKNITILLVVVIFAILANIFVFYAIKREDVSELEPIWVMQPLFTIILAYIFFSSERDSLSILFAIIASFALIFSHMKKNKIYFNKYSVAAALGSLFFAIELVLSNIILPYYNGFTFYFIRCFFVLVFCYAIFRPSGKELTQNNIIMIALVGIFWMFYRAIIYYGYETLGIIFTTTIFILSPVLMFIFATIFLKEKPTMKQVISTAIIVACVVASIFIS